MADATYYELLDLEPSATADEIKAAYLRIMKIVHPDKGGSGGLFRQIQMAYETLSDPVRRAAYDRNGYADQDERISDPAPGWRGADNRPPNDPGPKAQSRSDSSSNREDSPGDELDAKQLRGRRLSDVKFGNWSWQLHMLVDGQGRVRHSAKAPHA